MQRSTPRDLLATIGFQDPPKRRDDAFFRETLEPVGGLKDMGIGIVDDSAAVGIRHCIPS